MTTALKARPTTYNGIEMRSRLEARVAAWLDENEVKWQYEAGAFASGKEQYLPDFLTEVGLPFAGKRSLYIEVKPIPTLDQLERMRVIWSSDPSAFLAVMYASDLEQTGQFWCYYQLDGRIGALAGAITKCPTCDWPTIGWLLGMAQFEDEGREPQPYYYCPLCDLWRFAPVASIVRLPEYGA